MQSPPRFRSFLRKYARCRCHPRVFGIWSADNRATCSIVSGVQQAIERRTMKKAIIVGGSMAGMLAGNMLIRQGWAVDILERTKEGLEARGAGIVPQRSLLAALGLAGVTVRPDIGIRLVKRVAYDRAGAAFATHAYDQYSTSWSLLYNLLRDAFPLQHFHAGRNVSDIVQDRDSAIAILNDGTKFEGDL